MQINTHASKANSYDIGRPRYPEAFNEYLTEIGLSSNLVIADVGAGTGKITRMFLERGNRVFAIEPDRDMLRILTNNLRLFSNYVSIESTAEHTGICANSIDLVFCGNSYHWFERNSVISEFRRILRSARSQNVIIATVGPSNNVYTDEFIEIEKKFGNNISSRALNTSPPFLQGMCISKIFEYVIYNEFNEFLHGALSASHTPTPYDDFYDDFCESLIKLFDKYSVNGKIKSNFKLSCSIGNVENLVP